MKENFLVTYATRTGSTAGVAEAIAKTLIENDAQVNLLPMQVVNDLNQYQVVVAGSAIQNKQWLPEAIQFMQTNQVALRQRSIAIFSVCMTLAMRNGEQYRSQVSEWITPVRSLVSPVSEGLFAGILDIGKIQSRSDRLKFRLSVLLGVWSEGDHRDWAAIQKWAESLPSQLLQQQQKERERE